jgi:hypothetical protein
MRSDDLDTASTDLWPEVVYPLIERAHWQRTFRPRHEAIWDYVVGKLLHVPVAGVRLDRMMVVAIPLDVAKQLDLDLRTFIDDPQLEEDETSATEMQVTQAQEQRPFYVGGVIPRDKPSNDDDDAPRIKPTVPLSPAEPFLFAQNTLRSLWEAAMDTHENLTRPTVPHRPIPVGPYELAVIPIGRSRASVWAVVKGMQQGKQIEIFTPSALTRDGTSRKVVAIWIYQDASMAVVHLDWQYKERCILWHAPDAQQFNFDYLGELRQRLSTLSLQVPDQLEGALSKKRWFGRSLAVSFCPGSDCDRGRSSVSGETTVPAYPAEQPHGVRWVAFAPDGKSLATAEWHRTGPVASLGRGDRERSQCDRSPRKQNPRDRFFSGRSMDGDRRALLDDQDLEFALTDRHAVRSLNHLTAPPSADYGGRPASLCSRRSPCCTISGRAPACGPRTAACRSNLRKPSHI